MAAVANNPKFAKKVGIPKATGEEFMKADKGRKFKEGGAMDMAKDKKLVKKAVGMHEKQLHGGKKSNLTKLRSGGSCGSKMKKYAAGGKVRYNDGGMPDYEREPDAQDKAQQYAAVADYKVEKGMNPNKSGEEEHMDAVKRKAVLDKPLAKASFKEAFADARASGDKTFEYMGKKYSTEMAKPQKSFADKAKKAGFTSAETKGGAALMTRKDRSTGMKAGGSVKARGCGIASKGLTKGRMV
jgi:hypothetical protein